MKLLHIYAQEFEHGEAVIKGNTAGLTELRDTLNRALANGSAKSMDKDELFTADGEGYEVQVELHDGHWGTEPDGSYNHEHFWNKEQPVYRGWS